MITRSSDTETTALDDGLVQLVEVILRHTAVLARAHGVAPMDLRAAAVLHRVGERRLGELANALGLSSSGANRVVARLVAAGLARCDRDQTGRGVRVSITDGAVDTLWFTRWRTPETFDVHVERDVDDRKLLATFMRLLAEQVDRDTDALSVALQRQREPVPSPPRWA